MSAMKLIHEIQNKGGEHIHLPLIAEALLRRKVTITLAL